MEMSLNIHLAVLLLVPLELRLTAPGLPGVIVFKEKGLEPEPGPLLKHVLQQAVRLRLKKLLEQNQNILLAVLLLVQLEPKPIAPGPPGEIVFRAKELDIELGRL